MSIHLHMLLQSNSNPSGLRMVILLLIIAGTAVLSLSPVSAEKPFVTIVAKGDQSYHMGEKVVFSGMNTGSNSTYLFITGPNVPDTWWKIIFTTAKINQRRSKFIHGGKQQNRIIPGNMSGIHLI